MKQKTTMIKIKKLNLIKLELELDKINADKIK